MAMSIEPIKEPGHGPFTQWEQLRYLMTSFDEHKACETAEEIKSWWCQGGGRRWSKKPTIAVFLCAEDEIAEHADFHDLLLDKEEIRHTFEAMGFMCKIYLDGSKDSLNKVLSCKADIRWIFAHGVEHGGVSCQDGFVDWTDVQEWMQPTGLLNMSPCYSANAMCEDEIDWLPLRDALAEKASAMILTRGLGHHFPWRYEGNAKHFVIQNFAYILQQCLAVGFRQAIEQFEEAISRNLPNIASQITDHEIAFGHEDWGLVDRGAVV